jgi:pilus assembly protein CpaB
MIARRWLVVLALGAGAIASMVYLASTAQTDVVVVAHDVSVPRALETADLSLRSVASALVPSDAIRSVDAAVGLVPRAPLLEGSIVSSRALASELADFRSGISLAPGQRAIALPVSAANAVGGAIVPGSRVDVIAVPALGRAPVGRTTELLATNALVLDVRAESGAPVLPMPSRSTAMPERIGSVVIAVAAADALRFADRVATSTFVLALAGAR